MKINQEIIDFMNNSLPENMEEGIGNLPSPVKKPTLESSDYDKCIKLISKWRSKRKDCAELVAKYQRNKQRFIVEGELIYVWSFVEDFYDDLFKGITKKDERHSPMLQDALDAFPEVDFHREYENFYHEERRHHLSLRTMNHFLKKWKTNSMPPYLLNRKE